MGNYGAYEHPAHIRTDGAVQTVREHCMGTARYAERCLFDLNLGNAGKFVGMMHDMGKCKREFSDYITAVHRAELDKSMAMPARGSVNHTFCAVHEILSRWHTIDGKAETLDKSNVDVASEVLAYACGAHHGQFDLTTHDAEYGFSHRLENPDSYGNDESVRGYELECMDMASQFKLYSMAKDEVMEFLAFRGISKAMSGKRISARHWYFYLGLTARLLLSSLVEGDRRDSCEFGKNVSLPPFNHDMGPVWRKCLGFLNARLAGFSHNGKINMARADISDRCLAAGMSHECGIHRLSVPTGSGKTMASLRYALGNALHCGHRRILYVAPLLSIIDQNGREMRKSIPSEVEVVEHHSNVVVGADNTEWEHYCEDWSAPVTVTTMVQFLNALFSADNICVRRMHALCNSVIIIDEVQSVPPEMLSLFNLAMNFLAYACHSTIVLCSATQPCLESTDHPMVGIIDEIAPYDNVLWSAFSRTRIIWDGYVKEADVPARILAAMKENGNVLVICNKKAQAKAFYDSLLGIVPHLYHLSTSMCMRHRKDTLGKIKRELDEGGEGLVCISTQLVEAGVDISFKCVIRLAAGVDNVIQSAGRCNRNGELNGLAPVYVLAVSDEDLSGLPGIARAKGCLCGSFSKIDEGKDMRCDEAFTREYYKRYYHDMKQGEQDFVVNRETGATLLDMLSLNARTCVIPMVGRRFIMSGMFKSAGNDFKVFDDETSEVVIDYKGGAGPLISGLLSPKAETDFKFRRECVRKLRQYTVSVRGNILERLKNEGGVSEICDGHMYLADNGWYDSGTGLKSPAVPVIS